MGYNDKPPSKAMVDPLYRLLCGAVLQAVYDIRSPDALQAVDALCFWVSDECSFWLDALGYPVEPEIALLEVISDGAYAKHKCKRKFSQLALRASKRDDTGGDTCF